MFSLNFIDLSLKRVNTLIRKDFSWSCATCAGSKRNTSRITKIVRSKPRESANPRCYPCQTCLPQEHWTVSVGCRLVSCCLQTGQGLVITYVIILAPVRLSPRFSYRARRLPKYVTLLEPRTAQCQSRSLRIRLCQHPIGYWCIELRVRPAPM